MTEPADQPLLAEEPGAETTPKRRRATAAKPRATAPKAASAEGGDGAAKPKARRVAKKKPAANGDLPGFEESVAPAAAEVPAPAAEASSVDPTPTELPAPQVSESSEISQASTEEEAPERRGRSRRGGRRAPEKPKPTAPPPGSGVAEEWSPSRREPAPQAVSSATSTAAPAPAPAPAATAAPVESQLAPTPEAIPEPPPARKYPVYIPRHVAKQMEEQGQTAPIAVPADAVPEAARAAVEAARAATPQPRPERQERQDRGDRGDRHDRGGRHQRGGGREERPFDSDRDANIPPPDAPLGEELGDRRRHRRNFRQGLRFHPRCRSAALPSTRHDIFVTPERCGSYNLRDGQWIKGETRRGGRGAQL